MKKENIISLIILGITFITYLIAMHHIKVIGDSFNTIKLYIIVNFTYLIILSGILLLWLSIRR